MMWYVCLNMKEYLIYLTYGRMLDEDIRAVRFMDEAKVWFGRSTSSVWSFSSFIWLSIF